MLQQTVLGGKIAFAIEIHYYAAAAKLLQSCPTPCDPVDGSPPGSSNHGIFQARVLEWGATGKFKSEVRGFRIKTGL